MSQLKQLKNKLNKFIVIHIKLYINNINDRKKKEIYTFIYV